MTGLNGKSVASGPRPPDPRQTVAEAMFLALADEGAAFADAHEDERQDYLNLAEHAIAAHVAFMASQGVRVIPPGSVCTPQTEEEAMAMVRIAKAFFDAQKRRGKLLESGPRPKGLILPGKLN
jgi:hypothetical protein